MLVLSRRLNEIIDVGDEVAIHVVDIRGDKVWLGIEAPKDLPVNRREITERIELENGREAK